VLSAARALLGLSIVALVLAPMAVGPVEAAGGVVVLAKVDGVVTRGTALHIEDALRLAEDRGAPLVLQLDTPGGLVEATLDIDRMLARASVPVLAYVGPGGGAFAASAGTFLLLMGQPSGMAPGATIGSAQPIEVGPTGGAQNASGKVTNFLVERIRSIADRTGRDPDVAARFITENLNLDDQEAAELGMVDVQAATLDGFLAAVHGMTARIGTGGTVVLDTKDARIITATPGLLPRVVDILSNPTVSFILFMAGLYSLIFGLANPGTYVPETIGAIMLLLGLIGLGLFGVTTAGFLLLLLAAAFFVAEVFTPTHGVLSVVGVIAMLLAAVFLIDGPLLPHNLQRRFMGLVAVLGIGSGLVVFGVVTLAMRSRSIPVVDRFRHARAIVLEPLAPHGKVEMGGEVWDAVASEPVPAGAAVRVVGRDGLLLHVETIPEPAADEPASRSA
jgi:membrane-bound serine protease (ClpP class)